MNYGPLKPHSIGSLTAETVNTTAVYLQWEQPGEYQSTYWYQVQTSGCLTPPQNSTTSREEITLTDLTPGTNCIFTVSVITEDGVEGEAKTISNYTKPETVQPNISNNQSNDTITVSWEAPAGNVESYEVLLRSRNGNQTRDGPGGGNQTFTFRNLSAGTIYNATVITRSGPFNETSGESTTATYPNPPESITITYKDTNSTYIEWTPAFFMTDADDFSYSVTISNASYVLRVYSTPDLQYNVTDLTSGTPHVICVKTAGPLGFNSTDVCQNATTKPHSIGSLTAETVNTTAVYLQWEQPGEYQSTYRYQVQTSGCLTPPQTSNTIMEKITLTDLTPGTNCIFTVSVITEDGVEGEAKSISNYTKPETVQPNISNNLSNDTITVSWQRPAGNVESYEVLLRSRNGNLSSPKLDGSILAFPFNNLSAGTIYNATVITKSGPFNERSEEITSATYPNPPRDIAVVSKTTSSIDASWHPPALMNNSDGFTYMVHISKALKEEDEKEDEKAFEEDEKEDETLQLSQTWPNLHSGTPYFICVKTIGPLHLNSNSSCIIVTTRPESVTSVEASIVTNKSITWKWTEPPDKKGGYKYQLNLTDDTNSTPIRETIREETYTFSELTPGVNYTVTVTTLTSDDTDGTPKFASKCTDTSGLAEMKCNGENQTPSAQLDLEWQKPEGQYTGFNISIRAMTNSAEDVYNKTLKSCSTCDHSINKYLEYATEYNVTIWTLGCGKAGSFSKLCKTGVTAPPKVTDSAKVKAEVKSHNTIRLTLGGEFLDPSSGPIIEYGVLVSDSTNPNFVPSDLANTYSDWKDRKASNYLATIQEPHAVSRSLEESKIIVILGDRQQSHHSHYVNGPLTPTKTYRFAVVTCTALVLNERTDRVNPDVSICSISPFPNYSLDLPQDPVVIITASGATVGVLAFFLIIAIGFFIFLKRKKNSRRDTDIAFSTMRNVPVQIEEFDAYFKRLSANTKCGFAEDFEDFKPVGTAQSTATASVLENKSKNRYSNVLPYEPARVKLSILSSQFDDYINASYIPGENSRKEFIAGQGPLPATVNDFWRMVWEKNVRTIVMLTRCNEQGRVKCEQYWPPESKHYNNIIVTTTSEIALDDWTLRDFDIKNVKTAETRAVRQFHYTAWPDHGVPETTELLINFRHLVREHMDQHSLHSPTIVHCSAGVGRTGTFIAIDRVIFQIERESKVDVFGIVYEMRMHRPLMVQTEDQYVFLNQCALDIIKSRLGTNVDLIYQNTAATSIYENVKPPHV
ncbi:receptor-type tyrosine-protein phosphatase eta-like [Engraulis encrasicolus]|uniref:receptor-type tyrosine-protein phosphatase eta-like n=1 Tax=Engraulis encrasicolus TaxID=184585 RepID=UPI002FD76E94